MLHISSFTIFSSLWASGCVLLFAFHSVKVMKTHKFSHWWEIKFIFQKQGTITLHSLKNTGSINSHSFYGHLNNLYKHFSLKEVEHNSTLPYSLSVGLCILTSMHVTFSCCVFIDFSWLWQFLRLYLVLMILIVWRIVQIFVGCPSIGNGRKRSNYTVEKPDNTVSIRWSASTTHVDHL